LRGLVGDVIKKIVAKFGRRNGGGLLASLIFVVVEQMIILRIFCGATLYQLV